MYKMFLLGYISIFLDGLWKINLKFIDLRITQNGDGYISCVINGE